MIDNVDTHRNYKGYKPGNLFVSDRIFEWSLAYYQSRFCLWNGDNTMMTRSFKYFIWGRYFKLGKGIENIEYPGQHFLEKSLSTTIRLGYLHAGKLHFQIIK